MQKYLPRNEGSSEENYHRMCISFYIWLIFPLVPSTLHRHRWRKTLTRLIHGSVEILAANLRNDLSIVSRRLLLVTKTAAGSRKFTISYVVCHKKYWDAQYAARVDDTPVYIAVINNPPLDNLSRIIEI